MTSAALSAAWNRLAKMHILAIQEKLPAPVEGGTGSDITGWSIVEALRHAGFQITLCVLLAPGEERRYRERRRSQTALEALGVRTVTLPIPGAQPASKAGRALRLLRRTVRPKITDFYPALRATGDMTALIGRLKPDAIVGFPISAVAVTNGVAAVPRVVVFGDLEHMIPRYRWQATPRWPAGSFLLATLRVIGARRQFDFMRRVLTTCDAVINLQAHNARWLQARGIPCAYVPLPTTDLAGRRWREERAARKLAEPRLLMIGNLRGTPTLPGLYLFAREILPALEQRLGPDGFRVHLVGRHALPADLRKALVRPSVVLRGYVEDAGPEFLSADVVLVPTPIELGGRTRIVVAVSYGCCTVAHQANLLGTPEFTDGRDILLGRTGTELAEAAVRALADPDLRARIGLEARRTYEKEFSIEATGRRLATEIARMTVRRATA